MRGKMEFQLLMKLGRWLFLLGLITGVGAATFGTGGVVYSFVKGGLASGFAAAVQLFKWFFLAFMMIVSGELIALLLAIHRTAESMRSELARLARTAELRGELSGTILDEFGIEVSE